MNEDPKTKSPEEFWDEASRSAADPQEAKGAGADADISGFGVPKKVPLAPAPSQGARLAAVKAAVNPLLEAAQPLLRALSDMPMHDKP